ncbi:MAG: hypothetical protein IKP98_02435 [Bacilli bacterium]|nr:hypothetical protein [Bacilli bacterium]
MVSMTKEQMISYLYDYANLQDMIFNNKNESVVKLFNEYAFKHFIYVHDTEPNYYDVMRRVYIAYNIFRYFSIIEDFLLNRDDFLSNNDLNGLEIGCQIIEAPHDLTNKRIIQLIRNAFNHNDSNDVDRFKISVNGKYFEINFKDIRTQKEIDNGVKPKPVRIKFDIQYLLKVLNIISKKRQNLLYLSFDIPTDFNIYSSDLDSELDKIKFVHYYFPKKMDKSTVHKLYDLTDVKGLDDNQLIERSNETNEYARQINEPIRYDLDSSQKDKLKDMITRYLNGNKPFSVDDYLGMCGVMYYFLSKVIPVPGLKIEDLEQQILICDAYLIDTNLSLDEILNRILRVINKGAKPDYYDEIDCEIHDTLAVKKDNFSRKLFLNCLDGEFYQVLPYMTFIDAVVTHYYNEPTIEINGEIYDREKIRNSFVHQRWYLDKDLNVCLFDADPRNINDYDLELVGKINVMGFLEWAIKCYKKNNFSEKTNKHSFI